MSKKISALPQASNPSGSVEMGVNDAGVSKRLSLTELRSAAPTLPSIVSVGAEFSSTGVPTATLPSTHDLNDVLVLCLHIANEADYPAPSGYTRVGPQNGVGPAAVSGTSKLAIFWKRDNGSESAPTLTDSGNRTYGMMFAVRGCPTGGDPYHMIGQAFKFTNTTTGTAAAGATSLDNCLVVSIFAHGIGAASGQGSSPTNSSLTNVTEQFDDASIDGIGGGLYVMSGVKAVAGSVAASTVTWASSTSDVSTTIAFVPADAVEHGTRYSDVQTFIGSATDLDDTWVKPEGATRIFVQICDGGGGGSGGNTTTTAAGGGGGGGGGYDEAWYLATELGATVTVHAGKGGVGASSLNQPGSPGVLSEFDKGSQGPLTSSRRIAGTASTAAASADGGNGGCGSGRGTTSPAVATTRISLDAATAGAALGGVGGRGGSGTTSPTGGSPAEWGGGGGESGSDTDASTTAANNGWSVRGGGGGGGGRTTTNVGNGAMGGGAAAPSATQGAAGLNSSRLPYGGSGGCGGGSSTVVGGNGGFPGGGGGGGAGVAGGFGGAGGHGCVVVTTFF